MIKIDQVKQLREETAAAISDCKKALEEAKGDLKAAKDILRKWGKDLARKKNSRETLHGTIASYIHPNKKIGVLLELNCETDFVAKGQDFQTLSHELCLQAAAMGEEPPFLSQPWIKDQSKTINDLVQEHIAKTGENITIKRFIRYEI
ncbi:MAG: translation elongation factor Ts [bacterium]